MADLNPTINENTPIKMQRLADWAVWLKQNLTVCRLQKIHLKQKDTKKVNVKTQRMENDLPCKHQ